MILPKICLRAKYYKRGAEGFRRISRLIEMEKIRKKEIILPDASKLHGMPRCPNRMSDDPLFSNCSDRSD
jgi:hypothetical protein